MNPILTMNPVTVMNPNNYSLPSPVPESGAVMGQSYSNSSTTTTSKYIWAAKKFSLRISAPGKFATFIPESMRYRYDPFLDLQSIRLLSIEPGIYTALKCRLYFAKLSDSPSYEALSYVWGNASKRTSIQCNGKSLSIPTSLALALYRFRHATNVRVIWADAICINQQDTPERNRQVTMMGDIYSNAKCVLAWLGKDSGKGKRAFDLIYELQQVWPYDIGQVMPLLKMDHPIFHDSGRWRALGKFLQNAYFKRGWIQQEIGLAKHAIIYWGTCSMPWDVICRTLHTFLEPHSGLLSHLFSCSSLAIGRTSQFYSTRERVQRISNRHHIRDKTPTYKNFWLLLDDATSLRFSDPHDVVYAFLGHPTARYGELKTPIVLIDYSKSRYELYTELAVKGLRELRNPLVLSLVSHSGDSLQNKRLPSWVHDLGRHDVSDDDIATIGRLEGYRTGTNAQMVLSVSGCNTRLSVQGVLFDCVAECRKEFVFKRHEYFNHYKECAIDALKFIEVQNTRSVYNDMSPELITSCVLTCRSLRGRIEIEKTLASFNAFRRVEFKGNIFSGYKPLVLPVDDKGSLQNGSSNQGEHIDFLSHLSFCYCRKVFRTQKGCFGLGPRLMEPGDFICVLFGFHTPYVLRKVGKHYLLIGECYVQGIMNGEIIKKWRDGHVEAMEFKIH